MKDKLSYSNVYSHFQEALTERSEWEAEWRTISSYLLPGRGVYQTLSKPRKRQLTSPKVINTAAEEALYVMTSGIHGSLTTPSRPWFKLDWADPRIRENDSLKNWLQDCEEILHKLLHNSNFYSVINSFYIEYGGYGTACTYLGEDTGSREAPFRFELLTAGEYAYTMSPDGRPRTFYRTFFLTARQLVEKYPNTVPSELVKRVKENASGIDSEYHTVLEGIYPYEFQDKSFTRVVYDITPSVNNKRISSEIAALRKDGFYEFPYPLARWGTIGSDDYGIGPGSRAIPDIKRLQEMEKVFLMAGHKTLDPPVLASARLRNKLNTLPGGRTFSSNPSDQVQELYNMRFDFSGVSAAIERAERRIEKIFFNDIFLSASRDPNASPMKARQVDKLDAESMLRLGPVVERLQHEYLQPMVERCFNIALRKQLLPPLNPDLAAIAGDYNIQLVSPLATAQRLVALQGINSYLAFLGQAAQFDPTILDNVIMDEVEAEYADITGVTHRVRRPEKEKKKLRAQRQADQQKRQQAEQQMMQQQAGVQAQTEQAKARKDQAEAGKILAETQQMTGV